MNVLIYVKNGKVSYKIASITMIMFWIETDSMSWESYIVLTKIGNYIDHS